MLILFFSFFTSKFLTSTKGKNIKTKVVFSGITATLALALTGCGQPTTLAEICKADMGSIKHFKGEVKVYKRVNYDWKYNMETQKMN